MDLPKRKPTRLKGYDYSRAGAYFVTICTKNKRCILSEIVGEGFHALPKNELTKIGTISLLRSGQSAKGIGKIVRNMQIEPQVW